MSKNFLKTNIVLLTILIFSLIPIFIFSAATSSATDLNIPNPLGETSDITTLVGNILNFLWKLAFVIAPILIVYAGYLYITSTGNEEKIKIAQKALTWAIIGFAIILIASSVPAIIQDFLSGEESSGIEGGGEVGAGIGVEGEINF